MTPKSVPHDHPVNPEPNMSFRLDEDQTAAAELAETIFSSTSTDERVAELERSGSACDPVAWDKIVKSGLLDVPIPESAGGAGLGMIGLTLVLEAQGRHLVRVPLLATAIAAMAGADLEKVRSGSMRVAAALPEPTKVVTVGASQTGYQLDGVLTWVPMAPAATHLLLIAQDETGERAYLIESERPGVQLEAYRGISGNVHATLKLTDVHVDEADELSMPAAAIKDHLLLGLAAYQAGVHAEAVERTARYTSEREQFGRPLSTNQGVAMRAADAYIDTQSARLTMLDAAWQLTNRPDSPRSHEAVLIASWWAREAGFRIVHATQHLHGGLGADTDYPIHRYFTITRENDLLWATAPEILDELGRHLTFGVSS